MTGNFQGNFHDQFLMNGSFKELLGAISTERKFFEAISVYGKFLKNFFVTILDERNFFRAIF